MECSTVVIQVNYHQQARKPLKRELDALVTQMHGAGMSYTDAVRQFKRRYILEVLSRHKGNQCKAATELGMHRNTLSRTLAELDLNTAQIRKGMRRPVMSERPMLGQRAVVNEQRPRLHVTPNGRIA